MLWDYGRPCYVKSTKKWSTYSAKPLVQNMSPIIMFVQGAIISNALNNPLHVQFCDYYCKLLGSQHIKLELAYEARESAE